MVVREVLLDGWAEEVEESGVVAGAGAAFAGEVAGEDLFFEGVEGVGDALEIFQVCDCAGDG